MMAKHNELINIMLADDDIDDHAFLEAMKQKNFLILFFLTSICHARMVLNAYQK